MALLLDFFRSDYMPHGHCFLWQPGILWLNVVADGLIAIAYFSIPVILFDLVRRRKDGQFNRLFLLFALFIFFCGVTHVVAIVNLWHGYYGVQGVVKGMTALVSIITAMVLYRLFPMIRDLPSPVQMQAALQDAAAEKIRRTTVEIERKAEAIFKFTTDLVPTGLLVVDRQQRIRLVNQALEKTFGYGPGELIGQPLNILLDAERTSYHEVLVEKYMQHPTQRHAMAAGRIVRGRQKNGSSISIEISLSVHEFEGEKHAFASVTDVGQVTTEKDLALERRNRIQRAIDATDDGIWEWNVNTGEVWFSKRLLKMTGLDGKPDGQTFAGWKAHIHPDDRERVMHCLEQHLQKQAKYEVTYRGIAEDGRYQWFHSRGDSIFDHENKPLLMSGILSNIQDMKVLEESLAEQSRFLNAILDKSLCGTYLFDLKQHRNIFINRQYTEITGYTFDDLQKQQEQGDLLALFHPDDQPKIIHHMAAVTKNRSARGEAIEYRFRHKDGHWIWCYSKDSVYASDHQGEPEQMLGTFFEISELKAREDKIQALAKDFFTTFEQAAVGIAHVGLDGSWLRVNAKLCDILGYPIDELLQSTFQQITYPEDLEADLNHVHELIEGRADHYSMEKRYVRKNGEMIWANLTVSIVRKADGTNSHFISVVEDISARKAVENALAESNQALERFAYAASHDLQEPLRKITSFSNSLERRLKDTLQDADAQFELSRMSDAALRMREMIDSLLQLSRYARQALNKEDLRLSQLVAMVYENLSSLLEEKAAKVVVAEDGVLQIDRRSFLQVLQNLVINSIRYAKNGVPAHIVLTCHEAGGVSVFQYQDNGTGFDPKYSTQIFEPFKRLVGRDIEGFGMGLAICRQIVTAHGGQIRADSHEGEGAVFEIRLPLKVNESTGAGND